MNAPLNLLEACWMLVDQDMMLDVAATIAATESATAAVPIKPAAIQPALAIHRTVREE